MTLSIRPQIKERLGEFLNLELYAIETKWTGSLEAIQEMTQAHLDHQVDMERRGILFAAGPLFEPDSPRFPPVAGLIVVRAESFEAAAAIANLDPMHAAGLRTYTIRKWIINEGQLNIVVQLSDQKVRLS